MRGSKSSQSSARSTPSASVTNNAVPIGVSSRSRSKVSGGFVRTDLSSDFSGIIILPEARWAIAFFILRVLASTRNPTVGLGGSPHDLDRQWLGGAGRRAACLFFDPGDVSLDQTAGPEDFSQLAREGNRFRGAGRQPGAV